MGGKDYAGSIDCGAMIMTREGKMTFTGGSWEFTDAAGGETRSKIIDAHYHIFPRLGSQQKGIDLDPSAIGGDAFRIFLAHKAGVDLKGAVNGVMLERVATLAGLILLVVMTQPFLLARIGDNPAKYVFPALAVRPSLPSSRGQRWRIRWS